MDAAAWPLVVVLVAILLSSVLLAITCLNCRDPDPLPFIPEDNTVEDSSDFIVVVQSEHAFNRGPAHHTSNHLLPPFSPAVEPGMPLWSRSSTRDTENNDSYENSGDGSGYVNDEFDRESDGYIIVVPGEEPNQSGPSTPSLHSYENVPGREYQNVDPCSKSTSDQSAQSDSESDDGDMGNYVNVVSASMSG